MSPLSIDEILERIESQARAFQDDDLDSEVSEPVNTLLRRLCDRAQELIPDDDPVHDLIGTTPTSITDVNGHRFLPSGGHRFSPLADMFFPRWWPSVLPALG